MKFADLLRTWRMNKGWSQADAAEFLTDELGLRIPTRTFSAWEAGTNQPHGMNKVAIEATIAAAKGKKL